MSYIDYMSSIESRLYRMSQNQLKALYLLATTKSGIISSNYSGKTLQINGKSLGGLYSSLSRQVFNQEHLIVPWGRALDGRGLQWKLNTKLISQNKLLEITKLLLNVHE